MVLPPGVFTWMTKNFYVQAFIHRPGSSIGAVMAPGFFTGR